MAAVYSLANTYTTNLTAGNALLDVVNPSSANQPSRVFEIAAWNNAAASNQHFGIARSSNNPVQTGGVTLLPDDNSDGVSKATIGTTWSVAPTLNTNVNTNIQPFYRRYNMSATQGAWILLNFLRGLILYGAQSSIMMWNISAITTGLFVHVVVEE